jgi:uncharacterized protein YcbX
MQIGTVAGLWRYPVKSLAAQSLTAVEIECDGLAGDRRAALIVRTAGHARSDKPWRGKEHHLLHTTATPQAACALAAQSGIAIEPISGERYFDAQPVSLIFDTWLHDVETLVGCSLDPQRYRPNIFALAAPRFSQREAALVGTAIEVGGARLRVVATIKRCVTTTYDVATGTSDPAILRAVATARDNVVGVYCGVERPGSVAHGDVLNAA